MKRAVLDQLARDCRFSEDAAALALDLSGARPDARAWRAFIARLLNGAGIAGVGAGVLFFVAANWQDYGVIGRFVLLQCAFVACVVAAWLRPPPHVLGNGALVMATLLVGGLLALFGQTYQTGADVFELFLAWSALALPLAFAARSGAVWAVWWVVLNVGLALYCGWLGPDHFLWSWIDRRTISKPLVLLVPLLVNFAGAAFFLRMHREGDTREAPRWLVRLLTAIAFGYGVSASLLALLGHGWARDLEMGVQGTFVVAVFALACTVVAVGTLRSRSDVFPMALIIGSWIVISTGLLIKTLSFNNIGPIFLVALWLIGTSTGAGLILMHWVRAWRVEEDAVEATA
jgi:uncharacterized membrane protein